MQERASEKEKWGGAPFAELQEKKNRETTEIEVRNRGKQRECKGKERERSRGGLCKEKVKQGKKLKTQGRSETEK